MDLNQPKKALVLKKPGLANLVFRQTPVLLRSTPNAEYIPLYSFYKNYSSPSNNFYRYTNTIHVLVNTTYSRNPGVAEFKRKVNSIYHNRILNQQGNTHGNPSRELIDQTENMSILLSFLVGKITDRMLEESSFSDRINSMFSSRSNPTVNDVYKSWKALLIIGKRYIDEYINEQRVGDIPTCATPLPVGYQHMFDHIKNSNSWAQGRVRSGKFLVAPWYFAENYPIGSPQSRRGIHHATRDDWGSRPIGMMVVKRKYEAYVASYILAGKEIDPKVLEFWTIKDFDKPKISPYPLVRTQFRKHLKPLLMDMNIPIKEVEEWDKVFFRIPGPTAEVANDLLGYKRWIKDRSREFLTAARSDFNVGVT